MSSENAALDLAVLLDHNTNTQLGIMLAIAEKGPEIVPRILAQLEDAGVAKVVTARYQQAKALLESVP
jgi:hypothetical protein